MPGQVAVLSCIASEAYHGERNGRNDSLPLREMKRQKLFRLRIVMGLSMSHVGGDFHYSYGTYRFVASSKCSSMQVD